MTHMVAHTPAMPVSAGDAARAHVTEGGSRIEVVPFWAAAAGRVEMSP
jgi:hypothetical protein